MIFSSPFFFWAFGLLAIPIFIHLFNFRRYKTLYFSDISLLKAIQTKSQTKNQLKHWLILAARLLFLAALIFAFTEPRIPGNGTQGETNNISIYVDNSLSMQQEGDQGKLLAIALQRAFDIASSYPTGTRFQLITNELDASQRHFVDLASLTSQLDATTSASIHRHLDDIIHFHRSSLEQAGIERGSLFAISDFQGTLDSGLIGLDTQNNVRLMPLTRYTYQNLSVDSVWLDEPLVQAGQDARINVRIHNYGFEPQDAVVKIVVDGQLVNSLVHRLDPGKYIDTTVSFLVPREGMLSAFAEVEDAMEPFDNKYYFNLRAKKRVRVVEIAEQETGTPFKQLFEGAFFGYTYLSVKGIMQDSLAGANLLVINQIPSISSGLSTMVRQHLKNAGNALLVLPERLDETQRKSLESDWGLRITGWDTAKAEVNKVETRSGIFRDVFSEQPQQMNYPRTHGMWKVNGSEYESVLTCYSGNSLLLDAKMDDGHLFLITAPLTDDHTNFHHHALFVPAVLNMALSAGAISKLSYTIGQRSIRLDQPAPEGAHVRNPTLGVDFIPSKTLNGLWIEQEITSAGQYELSADTGVSQILSFNYSREESVVYTSDAVASAMEALLPNARQISADEGKATMAVSRADLGTDLWPLFLALALLFFLVETVLLKILFK